MPGRSEGNLRLKTVLCEQLLCDSNVLLSGSLLRLTSTLVPCLPLGLGLEAEHSGLLGLVITFCGLLIPPIEGQEFIVAETFVGFLEGSLDGSGSGIKLFLAHECRIFYQLIKYQYQERGKGFERKSFFQDRVFNFNVHRTSLSIQTPSCSILQRQMGVQNSSMAQIQALGRNNQNNLQSTYYTQIYRHHKKNMAQFKQALTSIIKRSSYLRYAWTQQLLDLLKNTSKDHLYHHYKTVLKENCLPTGHHPQTFYASQTRDFFRASFDRHQQKLTTSPSFQHLVSLAEECKAFLMVMAWLHQLTQLESHMQEVSFQESRDRWDEGEEDNVCSKLLLVSERYFGAVLREYPREHRLPAKLQHNITVLMRVLKKKSSFTQRKATIQALEDILSIQPSLFKNRLEDICEVFGREVVFAHVFVAREMVGSVLSKSWQIIQTYLNSLRSPLP